MPEPVLIVYASKYGATREIAEKIGQTLENAGLAVTIAAADQVNGLEGYEAVILGSAVYAGMWRKEAIRFLENHEAVLSTRPLWIFSSGPTGHGNAVDLLNGWRFPEAQKSIADRIQPRDITVFHGAIDPAKLNFAERMIVKGVKAPSGDFREWPSIQNWAQAIAEELGS